MDPTDPFISGSPSLPNACASSQNDDRPASLYTAHVLGKALACSIAIAPVLINANSNGFLFMRMF